MSKKRATRVTRSKELPKSTALQRKRAEKLAAPFLDEMQRAVDEQTRADFGLPPQDPKQAAAFRKRIRGLARDKE